MLPDAVNFAGIRKPRKVDNEEPAVLDCSETTFEPHGYFFPTPDSLLTRS